MIIWELSVTVCDSATYVAETRMACGSVSKQFVNQKVAQCGATWHPCKA